MIVVTHLLGSARDVAKRVVFFHQGKIAEAGAPKAIRRPPQIDRPKARLALQSA